MLYFGVLIKSSFKKKNSQFEITPEILRSREYNQVQTGENSTQSEYVTFDAFFLKDLNGDGKAESLRGTCNRVGKEDTLYFELRVINSGYLKNGTITVNGQNFYLGTAIVKDNVVANNYISNNTTYIKLKDVDNGTQRLFTGIVRSGDYSNSYSRLSAIGIDTNNYSKVNSITLTGTHVDDEGNETPISKTVNFNVDWYGITSAGYETTNISQKLEDFSTLYNSRSINLSFNVQTTETANELLLKQNVLQATIPELNEYAPTAVRVAGTGITYEYDKDTRQVTVRKQATLDDAGVLTKSAYTSQTGSTRKNNYTFYITYPKEAYTETENQNLILNIPVTTYYEGYNNPNDQFDNPYVSNVAQSTLLARWYYYQEPSSGGSGTGGGSSGGSTYVRPVYSTRTSLSMGRYVSTPYYRYVVSKEKPLKIYNEISEEERQDYYTVSWYAYTGTYTDYSKIVFKENDNGENSKIDTFIKTDSTEEGMDGILNYAGIYFSSPSYLLKQDGYIKVYDDDTNELLVTFDSNNWNTYNSSNPYMYSRKVKHIRVETSETNEEQSIYIYNIKEIDDSAIVDKYYLDEFNELQYIRTNLVVYFGDSTTPKKNTATVYYEAPSSRASFEISKNQITTQETLENQILTIETIANQYNETGWKDGTFIIKVPSDIVDMSLNSVTVNNSDITISDKTLYQEDGNYYLRIETTNENATTYKITINCNITPDPRIPTTTESFELYAKNGIGAQYFYKAKDVLDVDMNANTDEYVHKSTVSISLISPASLITNQVASHYDRTESITIAPVIALVEKEQRKATVEINLTNNYTNKVKNVQVQGVIPFEGNKFVLGSKDLGSEYSATMSSSGVTVPSALSSHATVYYSEQAKPTNDIKNSANGWMEKDEVTDWSKIKNFIIDMGDYEFTGGEQRTFSYEINIPEGIDYNKVAYSQHAVYFSLTTSAGLYDTSVSVAKLGFMIAKQYDLEISKYQENTSKLIEGVTFKVTEVGNEENSIKKITDSNGKVVIKNLYAEREYKIQETKTVADYVLNDEEIHIYSYVDDTDTLHVKFKEDNGSYSDLTSKYSWLKSAEAIKEDDGYKVKIGLENEVKARLSIIKSGNNELLKGIKFRLSGRGKDDIILTTNASGKISTTGLFLNETYTLEETRATGYYLIEEPITFRITSSASGFELQTTGSVGQSSVTTNDEIPTINLDLDDEKIPTYSLKLTKYAKHKDGVEDVALEGAQFKIRGDGMPSNGQTFETDQNGILQIDGLYEYVEEAGAPKGGYTGIYTIEEIYAPEGYALDPVEIQFRGKRNSSNELELEIISGEDALSLISARTVNEPTSENPVAEFSLENAPIFTLTKYDENGDPLADVKFEVYELNDNLTIKGFAKNKSDEYVGELNNEKYTVTTDENGEISLNLKSGLYKAVEVEAPEKYDLSDSEEKRTKYFGINKSRAEESTYTSEWKNGIKGEGWNKLNSVYACSDGGSVVAGAVYGSADLNNDGTEDLTSAGGSDGLVVKYAEDGSVDWSINIGGTSDEEFNKIIQTRDGGYAVVGYFSSNGLNVDSNVRLSGAKNAILVKLSNTGTYQWSKVIAGDSEDEAYYVYEDSSQNLMVTGCYYSTNLNLGDEVTLTRVGEMDGFVAKYSSSGTCLWAQNLSSTTATLGAKAVGVTKTSEGYAVAVNWFGVLNVDTEKSATIACSVSNNTATQNGAVIFYDENGTYLRYKQIASSTSGRHSEIKGVITLEDGNILAYGDFIENISTLGTAFSVSNTSTLSSYLFKFQDDGTFLADKSLAFGGTGNDQITSASQTDSGDILISGFTASSTIDIDGDGTSDITQNPAASTSQGYIARLNDENKVTAVYRQYGSSYTQTEGIVELENGGIVLVGTTDANPLKLDSESDTLALSTESNGFVVKYNTVITAPEIKDRTSLSFTNKLKTFNITAEVYSAEDMLPDGTGKKYDVGGTLTGSSYGTFNKVNYQEADHIQYVESVTYGFNGTKELTITPAENYSITSIKINNEDYLYVPDDEGKVTIPSFENVTEDIHIVVEVNKDVSSIMVNHNLWTQEEGITNSKVATSDYIAGIVGDDYTTAPKLDLEYEIVTNQDFYGNKTEEEIISSINTEYGTTYTDLSDLGYVEITDTEDENYGKTPLEQFLQDFHIPVNATGKYTEAKQVINYYYKEKLYTLTVKHLLEGTEDSVPSKTEGLVQDEVTENLKKYVDDETTPTSKYTTARSQDIDYDIYELVEVPENSEGTITEDTVVNYYYRLTTRQITTKVDTHEETDLLGDTIDVKGGTISGEEDEPYETVTYGEDSTKEIKAIPDAGFVVKTIKVNGTPIEVTPNADKSVTLTQFTEVTENKEIAVEFQRVQGTVIIHHYEEGTTTPVTLEDGTEVEDEIKTGDYGDIYASKPKEGLDAKYTVVDERPVGSSGTFIDGTIEVTYYYRSESTILTVSKVWSDNNNSLGIRPTKVNVRLTAKVVDGEGTETDYELDSSIATTVELNSTNGSANGNKWTYQWDNLKFTDETSGNEIKYYVEEVPLEGNLAVVYSSEVTEDPTDSYKYIITNTYTAPTEKIKYVVNKIWDDDSNSASKRPDELVFNIQKVNADSSKTQVATYTLNTASETSHTFELDKYDNKGNEINYIAEEKEKTANDLYYYTTSGGDKQEITLEEKKAYKSEFTNTFTVPDEKVNIPVTKVWNDNSNENTKRPSSIKLVLYKVEAKEVGGVQTTENVKVTDYTLSTPSTSNTFDYTFTNVQKYDSKGNEITYIVEEEEVNSNDLKFYSKQVEETNATTHSFTITNTFTVPEDKIEIEATKVWSEANETQARRRPTSVTLKLKNGETQIAQDVANSTNSWRVTFTNIAKYDNKGNEIAYKLDEAEVTQGDLKFYTKSESSNLTKVDDSHYTLSISNTFTKPNDTIEKKVTKQWNDGENERLSSIKLVLTGDGQEYKQTLTSSNVDNTNSNNWIYTFNGLPKYNSNGEEIEYVLSEEEVNTGDLSKYIQSVENYTVSNNLIIKDTKIESTGTTEITSLDETLNYTINYEAQIDKAYEEEVTFTITTTLPYEIDTTKEYNLNGGKYDSLAKTVEWKAVYNPTTNKLTYKKWDSNTWKNEGTVTLDEQTTSNNVIPLSKQVAVIYKDLPVNVPSNKLTTTSKGTIELSNSVSEEKETTFDTNVNFKRNITVVKQWYGDTKEVEGINTILATRPTSLGIQIRKNGEVAEEDTLSTTNSWKKTFLGLPKYDETTKQEIEYTVTESSVPTGYYSEVSTEDVTSTGANNLKFVLNNNKYGSIKITKVDKNDNTKKIGGAQFTLKKLKEEDSKLVVDDTFEPIILSTSSEQDTEGIVTFEHLQYGTYRLQETKAPEGYQLHRSAKDIEIKEEQPDYEETITNTARALSLPDTGGKDKFIMLTSGLALLVIVARMLNLHKAKIIIYIKDTKKSKK